MSKPVAVPEFFTPKVFRVSGTGQNYIQNIKRNIFFIIFFFLIFSKYFFLLLQKQIDNRWHYLFLVK